MKIPGGPYSECALSIHRGCLWAGTSATDIEGPMKAIEALAAALNEREALILVARAAARHADDDAPDHQQTWRDLHDALAAIPAGLLESPTTPRTQSENQA